MGPDNYIPLCEAMGWPEWHAEAAGFQEQLQHSSLTGWWIAWMDGNCEWHNGEQVAAHVALCILEKWAREKFGEAGIAVSPDHICEGVVRWSVSRWDPFGYLQDNGRTWGDYYHSDDVGFWPTEAEAQIAALKTLCKETDDG